MNYKSLIAVAACMSFMMFGCNSNKQSGNESGSDTTNLMKEADASKKDEKGIGKFKDVKINHPLDQAMLAKGEPVFATKCFACHKLTNEKLVGPGWKGVTDRRAPEWILNFITNTNMMLDSDLVAQQLMVVCLVRMPNQSLTDDEARSVYEFMRKNDGKN